MHKFFYRRFRKIAFYLFPYRKCFLFIALCFFMGLIYSLTIVDAALEAYSTFSLIGILWSLLLFVMVTVYHKEVKTLTGHASFLTKLKIKILRLFRYLLGISFAVLISASVYLTSKLLTL